MNAFFPKTPVLDTDVGLVALSATDFDTFDMDVLRVARSFFANHQDPQSHAWKTAFGTAEQLFAVPFGATLAHAVSMMVDALVSARKRPFSFLATHHQNAQFMMTREEFYLVSVLHEVRSQNTSQARIYAMLVCEGAACEQLLFVAQSIAVITGEGDA